MTREGSRFGEGFRWEGDDPQLLSEVIEAAFDYRGDVTLLLRGGEDVEGYVFNRDASAPEPFLQIFPADGSQVKKVLYRSLRGIAFTGRDTASGKSWESWLKKHKARKEAEGRGERTEPKDLFPPGSSSPA